MSLHRYWLQLMPTRTPGRLTLARDLPAPSRHPPRGCRLRRLTPSTSRVYCFPSRASQQLDSLALQDGRTGGREAGVSWSAIWPGHLGTPHRRQGPAGRDRVPSAFPQESAHHFAWWKDRRCDRSVPTPLPTQRPAAGDAGPVDASLPSGPGSKSPGDCRRRSTVARSALRVVLVVGEGGGAVGFNAVWP